jgi:transcriptional regulator with XRE-family HTH domain
MTNVRLKLRMLETGITGYDLARRVGVSDSQFSRIVRGWIDPPLQMKNKLAEALGCQVQEVFEQADKTVRASDYE